MLMYRYLGVLSILLAWIAIGLVLHIWPVVKSQSISKHVSTQKQSYLLFAVLATASYTLFYGFAVKWLIPTYKLPRPFNILLVIGLVFELVAAWVPDTKRLKHWIHHYVAYAAALLLPVLTWLIAASTEATLLTKVVCDLAIIVMMSTLASFLFVKMARQKHLIYQSIYVMSFHVAIITAIFSIKP